jgi:hypothetical protein
MLNGKLKVCTVKREKENRLTKLDAKISVCSASAPIPRQLTGNNAVNGSFISFLKYYLEY